MKVKFGQILRSFDRKAITVLICVYAVDTPFFGTDFFTVKARFGTPKVKIATIGNREYLQQKVVRLFLRRLNINTGRTLVFILLCQFTEKGGDVLSPPSMIIFCSPAIIMPVEIRSDQPSVESEPSAMSAPSLIAADSPSAAASSTGATGSSTLAPHLSQNLASFATGSPHTVQLILSSRFMS